MALEAQDSVRALGVNWDAVTYAVSYLALFTLLLLVQIRWRRSSMVPLDWSAFGRMLVYSFLSSLGAGLISMRSPHVVFALIQLAVLAMMLGPVVVLARIRIALRGRPK